MTEGLMGEIESYHPKPDHLLFYNHKYTYKREKHRVVSKCKQIFPKKQIFASYKQLKKDIIMFVDHGKQKRWVIIK